jgi:hypothetical protein
MLVREDIIKEVQDCNLKEAYSQSYFNKHKSSLKGLKSGALIICPGQYGGFYNKGKENKRIDGLKEIL